MIAKMLDLLKQGDSKTRTIKVRVCAYQALKLVAALRGCTMLDAADQVVGEALEREQAKLIEDGYLPAPGQAVAEAE